jgi:hypothetical protein
MDCEKVKIYLPEFIDGELDLTKSDIIKKHLQECGECKKLYKELDSFMSFSNSLPEIEVPDGMKDEFLELVELDENNRRSKVFIPVWIKIAAVVVFAFSTFASGYFAGTKNDNTQLFQTELNQLRQEVIRAELQDLSGPQKIQAVYNAQAVVNPDDKLIDALVYTMNSDKNINVRLAAINALTERIENQNVKNALINSLAIQGNPLLQISLIQVLAGTGDQQATEKIQSFANDKTIDKNVRSHAESVIQAII